MIVLPDTEDRTIVCSFVWTKTPEREERTKGQTHRQTDRPTNGQNSPYYYSALYCEQCGRAVKMKQSV